jgi:hypothetical protein
MSYGYCNDKWHNASIATTQGDEPSKGKLSYDGQNYLFLETKQGPTMFAEIRGNGAGLPMDANAQKICDLWNAAAEPKPAPQEEKHVCVDCRDYEANIRGWIEQLGGDTGTKYISLELERLIDALVAQPKPTPQGLAKIAELELEVERLKRVEEFVGFTGRARAVLDRAKAAEARIAELESAQPKADPVEKLVSDEDLQNLITSTFNTIKLLAIELQQRRQREERRGE